MRLSKICVFLPLLLLFAWISCDAMSKFPPLLWGALPPPSGQIRILGSALLSSFGESGSGSHATTATHAVATFPTPVPAPIPGSTKPTRKRKSNEVDPANVIHTARPRKAPSAMMRSRKLVFYQCARKMLEIMYWELPSMCRMPQLIMCAQAPHLPVCRACDVPCAPHLNNPVHITIHRDFTFAIRTARDPACPA
ncbi:hypothetical protein DFH08DRAFT_819749 [Mycena albidolilacea]|uniref:Secreted protein n=1 Tax=Mycena albidolilacea TaxID=1033008 RepID=A0AAD6ZDR3_9AGAR|nr:hypothetical protein DFH08DRAFT_819749 [Mycena albidolilacea]